MMKSYAPKTMAELPASLAALTPESKIVGGGTDFVIRLHSGAVQPDALCYLGHIPELKKIEKQGDTISVGAYCTMTQMEHDPIVREYLPALMDAAADVGSLQIRNNGTIGGNLGNASPAGDLIPVMYLYDAKVEIASPNGTRIVPVTDVILRPGKTILEALNTDLVCDAINVAMRELFLQIVYGRSQTAFSENGLPVGAGLDDLGKGLRSMTGTIFSTKAKGVRYLELTEGYILKTALDKDNQVIGYQFVRLGKMLEAIRHGMDPKEAYEKNIGTYGRFSAEQGAVKYIDPREE